MPAQPKMTSSRQRLSPYRGFPVESSCPEPSKFSSRAAAAPRLSIACTSTCGHEYDYDYAHEERARKRRTLRPHDPKVR
jgi:hypothetical protein